MDDFLRNLKKKLSTDAIVEFMKEANLISDDNLKEKDVREALEKMDPNKIVNVDELATKLNVIAEQSKSKLEELQSQAKDVIEETKSSLTVLQKPAQPPDTTEEDEMAKHEDIIAFYN